MSKIAGARELDGEAGVEHVARRHALVGEAALGADVFGDAGEEGDDVVLHLALDLVDAGDVELALLAVVVGGALRDRAEFGHRLHGERLDLEPDAVAALGLPDRHHFGACVTRNHGRLMATAHAFRQLARSFTSVRPASRKCSAPQARTTIVDAERVAEARAPAGGACRGVFRQHGARIALRERQRAGVGEDVRWRRSRWRADEGRAEAVADQIDDEEQDRDRGGALRGCDDAYAHRVHRAEIEIVENRRRASGSANAPDEFGLHEGQHVERNGEGHAERGQPGSARADGAAARAVGEEAAEEGAERRSQMPATAPSA